MGNFRRVVYEKSGDLSPETRKGRKIDHDLKVLENEVQTKKELLLFKESNDKLYTLKKAWNYLKEFKNLKDDKDLHKASYIAAMQVCLRFFKCYDGQIDGKWLNTRFALKRFGDKYQKYGKVKGIMSDETLNVLEKVLQANEAHCKKMYK